MYIQQYKGLRYRRISHRKRTKFTSGYDGIFSKEKKNTKQQPLSVGALMVVGRYMLWFLLYTTKSELML